MENRIRSSGKASSVPGGLAIAVFVSMITTVVSSALIANALNQETITWTQAGYWIMGMLFIASLIGAKCAFAAIKRQRMVVSMMSGVLYWGILLCITALFFGGKFGAVWETAGLVGAGSAVAALLSLPRTGKNQRKTRMRYR